MFENNSPWIKQLNRQRNSHIFKNKKEADVAIVGGGIAGISTAYFLLKETNYSVALFEADKIAHGATGHNAGQITSYFEKTFTEMVEEFGLDLSVHATKAIENDARKILSDIYSDMKINLPHSEFMGYDGWATRDQILKALQDLSYKEIGGLLIRKLLISKEYEKELSLPYEYKHLYSLIPHKDILDLLETTDESYIAVTPFLSGCLNSALFTEELATDLLFKFPERFFIAENKPVSSIVLEKEIVEIVFNNNEKFFSKNIILCTNGFENIKIINNFGLDIDAGFHHEVIGVVGYMAGYISNENNQPFASIYSKNMKSSSDPYMYVTRRHFGLDQNQKNNLICVGGPEKFLPDRAVYDKKSPYFLSEKDVIDTFVKQTFKNKGEDLKDVFLWHGLMGYTKNKMRLIGPEPKNPRMLYNLGCNGVGILPSLYGAKRISLYLKGEKLEPSVFDPK